jgi:NADH:ubiquinone oxidoreductase subunit 3 (subunit A)
VIELTFPLVVLLAFLVSLALYAAGSALAPKVEASVGKLAAYACGEEFRAIKHQVDVKNFFLYVAYFMVFDVSAFFLATSYGNRGLIPLVFITITLLSIVSMIPFWRGKQDWA